jgi:hypothetical protein
MFSFFSYGIKRFVAQFCGASLCLKLAIIYYNIFLTLRYLDFYLETLRRSLPEQLRMELTSTGKLSHCSSKPIWK